MTIKALAQAMDIKVGKILHSIQFLRIHLIIWYIDHIYDCLIHIKNGDQYSSDNQGLWSYSTIE